MQYTLSIYFHILMQMTVDCVRFKSTLLLQLQKLCAGEIQLGRATGAACFVVQHLNTENIVNPLIIKQGIF